MSAEYFIPDKEYFTIKEASQVTQVPAYTIRYWESVLHQPRPVRRKSGHRRYTRKDLEAIFRIKELLYRNKLTLAGAKKTLNAPVRKKEGGAAPSFDPQTLGKLKRELREILLELSR